MELDIQRILRILPHRTPFLLLDRVTEVQPRKSARAFKCVSYGEPWALGHFPGHPVYPNVLLLESMFQLLAVLAYASEPFDSAQKVVYFLGVEQAKFRKAVVPGDRVELEVEVSQRRSNIWKASATATVDKNLSAQAEILAAVTDREQL